MNVLLLPAVAVVLLLPLSTLAAQPAAIFVTSVGAVNGLSDPNKDNQDTVTDIRNTIRKDRKTLRLVDTREEALVVLVVLGREAPSQGMPSGLFGLPMRDYVTRGGELLVLEEADHRLMDDVANLTRKVKNLDQARAQTASLFFVS